MAMKSENMRSQSLAAIPYPLSKQREMVIKYRQDFGLKSGTFWSSGMKEKLKLMIKSLER